MFDSVEKIDGKIVYWLTKDLNDKMDIKVGVIIDREHETLVTGEVAAVKKLGAKAEAEEAEKKLAEALRVKAYSRMIKRYC
jgi:hypothetical protein